MEQSRKDYKRIVVKVGSSLLYPDRENPNLSLFSAIASQFSTLISEGKELVLVSSGAIASAMNLLDLKKRPTEIDYLQSASAIGQIELMKNYCDNFQRFGLKCAQVLLTWEDFDDRKRNLNAKNTLLRLLRIKGVVPVINENDTISTEEIKFGDNDTLSALVASLICADMLIILSDVDGLLDEKKEVIDIVAEITPQIKKLSQPSFKKASVGGMATKIKAAQITVNSGIPCVIANGRKKDIILSVIKEPQRHGTLFLAQKSLTARKRWIAYHAKPKGKIFIDEGAKNAILKNQRSLLAQGIIKVEGDFKAGDIVQVMSECGEHCASGRSSVESSQISQVMGKKYSKEIIHRNDMVIVYAGER